MAGDEPLWRLIGIDSEERVPSKWSLSRFKETLGKEPYRSHLKVVFQT